MPDLVGSRSIFTTGDTPMRLTCLAAAFAAAASSIAPAQAGGEWPDGPNKAWFEKLQRPDNHLAPYRNIDPKSLSCCGIADTIKTKFRVEAGTASIPKIAGMPGLKMNGF